MQEDQSPFPWPKENNNNNKGTIREGGCGKCKNSIRPSEKKNNNKNKQFNAIIIIIDTSY